jgi:hypothetical protein
LYSKQSPESHKLQFGVDEATATKLEEAYFKWLSEAVKRDLYVFWSKDFSTMTESVGALLQNRISYDSFLRKSNNFILPQLYHGITAKYQKSFPFLMESALSDTTKFELARGLVGAQRLSERHHFLEAENLLLRWQTDPSIPSRIKTNLQQRLAGMKFHYASKPAVYPINSLIWAMSNSYDFKAIAMLDKFTEHYRNYPGMKDLVRTVELLVQTRLKPLNYVMGHQFGKS